MRYRRKNMKKISNSRMKVLIIENLIHVRVTSSNDIKRKEVFQMTNSGGARSHCIRTINDSYKGNNYTTHHIN